MKVQIYERKSNESILCVRTFPLRSEMTRLQSGRGLLLARIQYTRVPLLYLEVEELQLKREDERYRFDMYMLTEAVQKECKTRRRRLTGEPIKRFKKVVSYVMKRNYSFYPTHKITFFSCLTLKIER